MSAQIYGAAIEKYWAGAALACNVQSQMNNPIYPTSIEGNNTGIRGVVCAGCSVTNSENVISSSTTDFATITLAIGARTTGSVAVKDNLTSYVAGTLAGFNIANPNLVNLDLLLGITVRTYLNGVLKESSTAATLVSLNSTLLNGVGEQLVGFVTTQTFDEIKLEVTNPLGVLNTTQVYNAVFQKFCAGGTAVTDLIKITSPTITTIPMKGTATVNLDGSISYTPNVGTSGTDTFIYSICDKINTTI